MLLQANVSKVACPGLLLRLHCQGFVVKQRRDSNMFRNPLGHVLGRWQCAGLPYWDFLAVTNVAVLGSIRNAHH